MDKINTECIGIDIGDKWCVVRGVDEVNGEVKVIRKARIETEDRELRAFFEGLNPTRLILEASTHSPWISRLLTDIGHDVFVVNPRRVQLISENNYKDDETDAELLARLGRADIKLLSPIEHREENCQADLVKIRARAVLVRMRSSLIASVRGSVKSFGGRIPSCSAESFGKKAREHLPEMIRDTMELMLSRIQELTVTIKRLERELEELGEQRYPEVQRLLQIPGVGPVTALCFVFIIQQPERFESNRSVGAYIGLCPGRNQSGEQDPDCRITKAGDGYLRQLLVQCGHWILNFGADSDLKRKGQRILDRGGKYARQKAAVAVARKLSVLMLTLWKTGKEYEPLYHTSRQEEEQKKYQRTYKLDAQSVDSQADNAAKVGAPV